MVNAVNFNNHNFYGEQKTSPNHNNGFSRELILVQNILIYLLEIMNTSLQG